jgi:hypothetical protein
MTDREMSEIGAMKESQKATNDKLIERFDKFVDKSEVKFVTRLEARVANATFAIIISLITVWFTIKDHIKS